MKKKSTNDHIIYIATFKYDNNLIGISFFQKQYGVENVIHTHDKKVCIDADKTYLSASNVDFEEVVDVDIMNWFFECIETGVYTDPPWKKSSTSSNTNVEMFNEFIN